MRHPERFTPDYNVFKDIWERNRKRKQHETDEAIEAQVVDVIEGLYGHTAVNEYEVEEFCRLDRFREFMLKAFVPSTKH